MILELRAAVSPWNRALLHRSKHVGEDLKHMDESLNIYQMKKGFIFEALRLTTDDFLCEGGGDRTESQDR